MLLTINMLTIGGNILMQWWCYRSHVWQIFIKYSCFFKWFSYHVWPSLAKAYLSFQRSNAHEGHRRQAFLPGSFQVPLFWLACLGCHNSACTEVQSSWHRNLNWTAHAQFGVHSAEDCEQAGKCTCLQKRHTSPAIKILPVRFMIYFMVNMKSGDFAIKCVNDWGGLTLGSPRCWLAIADNVQLM